VCWEIDTSKERPSFWQPSGMWRNFFSLSAIRSAALLNSIAERFILILQCFVDWNNLLPTTLEKQKHTETDATVNNLPAISRLLESTPARRTKAVEELEEKSIATILLFPNAHVTHPLNQAARHDLIVFHAATQLSFLCIFYSPAEANILNMISFSVLNWTRT
jgi:hypothetical protein